MDKTNTLIVSMGKHWKNNMTTSLVKKLKPINMLDDQSLNLTKRKKIMFKKIKHFCTKGHFYNGIS